MRWVKLTDPHSDPDVNKVWVNLDLIVEMKAGGGRTWLYNGHQGAKEDYYCIEVTETPEEILKAAGV